MRRYVPHLGTAEETYKEKRKRLFEEVNYLELIFLPHEKTKNNGENICLHLILLLDVVQQNLICMMNVFKGMTADVTFKRDIVKEKNMKRKFCRFINFSTLKTPLST
ncbi:hypothetical protein TNCV_3116791 [Trichonephila clavipes]|nr:hypothetical protein TNCV_3116791 [Trichonephila clavipes]